MPSGMQFYHPYEYLPKVEKAFEEVKLRLQQILPGCEIEHVGSSAINGAVSKGDLDILVKASKEDFPTYLKKIQTIGFHIKEGTLRTESLCMLESPDHAVDVAIQLIEKGSKFEMFITFRDRLNANPELVKRYNELKLASAGMSAEEYRERKSRFIEEVLQSNAGV